MSTSNPPPASPVLPDQRSDVPTPMVPAPSGPGLANLATLPLSPANQTSLDRLMEGAIGTAPWCARKAIEARKLFALSQIAPRLRIVAMDLSTELQVMFDLLATPVPCLEPGWDQIRCAPRASLMIDYPEDILRRPIPGTQPVRLLAPRYVWHSNVGPYGEPIQALCLGASIPRGFPLYEMVLSSYAALTLQAVSLDNRDPAGLLNADAARTWQRNAAQLPLSSDPFLGEIRTRAHEPTPIEAAPPAGEEVGS